MEMERKIQLADKFGISIWGWPDGADLQWTILDRLEKAERRIEELQESITAMCRAVNG